MKYLLGSTVLFIILAAALAFIAGGGLKNSQKSEEPLPKGNQITNDQTQNKQSAEAKIIKATISTNKGDIVLELYPNVAPKTVDNFVKLAKDKFYDGTKFHRVIPEFMIQGGDPLSKDNDPSNDGTGGPGYAFEDEINPKALGLSDLDIAKLKSMGYTYQDNLESMKVDPGVIAMANSGPNTNGSQFFIVTYSPQPHLNGRHTVFGKVMQGMDVVRSIRQGDPIKMVTIDNK